MPSRGEKARFRSWALPGWRDLDAAVVLAGTMKYLGWFKSAAAKAPVDGRGRPVPWYTYPSLMWLDEVVQGNERVFEYGSGNSTIWWASRVAAVTAAEHDEEWGQRVSDGMPANVTLCVASCSGSSVEAVDGDGYVNAIEGRGIFDVVIVDGVARVSCIRKAVEHLADGGLIVLDNSDRPQYAPAVDLLIQEGFTHIPFHGLAPGNRRLGTTSVFSRDLGRWTAAARTKAESPQSYEAILSGERWSIS